MLVRSLPAATLRLLVVALVALAAACSSSTSTGTSGTTAGTNPAGTAPRGSTPGGSAPSGKVLRIGVLAPIDGGLTAFGKGILNSVELAVDQANAAGAVPGWTIEVVPANDSSDPAVGEEAAKDLAATPNLIGVVGPYNSGVAAKAAPVLAGKGIPMLSPGNTDPKLTVGTDTANPKRQWESYFRLVANDSYQGKFLATQARALGLDKAAVVSETKSVSKTLADTFASEFTKAGGTVVVQQTVPDDASDFTDFLAAAQPLGPQLIFFGGEYPVAAKLRQQASTAGLTVPIMGGDGIKDDAYITEAGPTSQGDYASSVGSPYADLVTARDFDAAYAKEGFADAPSDFGPYAYDAANLLIEGASKAMAGQSSVTPAVLSSIVASVQSNTATGITGPLAFDQYGDTKNIVFTLYQAGPSVFIAKTTARVL